MCRLPSQVTFIKRYSFDYIVREGQDGLPSNDHYCSFDIVGSAYRLATDAEVLKVISEIIKDFTPKKDGTWKIKINHIGIIKAILELCNIDEKNHAKVCKIISKYAKHGYSWHTTKTQLQQTLKLSEDTIKVMQQWFNIRGEPAEIHQKLTHMFGKQSHAREALNELALLVSHFDAWPSIRPHVQIDLSCTYLYNRYSGVLFTVSIEGKKHSSIVGYGGRYERLLQPFWLFKDSQNPPNVCGVCFKLDKFMSYTTLTNIEMPHFSNSVPDVLVTSIGRGMLAERMQLCNELWNAKIKTYAKQQKKTPTIKKLMQFNLYSDFMYDDKLNYQEVKTWCKEHNVKFIIQLQSVASPTIKVELLTEPQKKKMRLVTEVQRQHLVEFLKDPYFTNTSAADQSESASNTSFDAVTVVDSGLTKTAKQRKVLQEAVAKKFTEAYMKLARQDKLIVIDFKMNLALEVVLDLANGRDPSPDPWYDKKITLLKHLKEAKAKKLGVCIYSVNDDRSALIHSYREPK